MADGSTARGSPRASQPALRRAAARVPRGTFVHDYAVRERRDAFGARVCHVRRRQPGPMAMLTAIVTLPLSVMASRDAAAAVRRLPRDGRVLAAFGATLPDSSSARNHSSRAPYDADRFRKSSTPCRRSPDGTLWIAVEERERTSNGGARCSAGCSSSSVFPRVDGDDRDHDLHPSLRVGIRQSRYTGGIDATAKIGPALVYWTGRDLPSLPDGRADAELQRPAAAGDRESDDARTIPRSRSTRRTDRRSRSTRRSSSPDHRSHTVMTKIGPGPPARGQRAPSRRDNKSLKQALGQLRAEDFYSETLRVDATNKARDAPNADVQEYGVAVEHVLSGSTALRSTRARSRSGRSRTSSSSPTSR